MPITIAEKLESRAGDNSSIDLIYVVMGTTDDAAVRTQLAATAPGSYNGLTRIDDRLHVEPIGGDLWLATARYEKPQNASAQENEQSFSFDTGGGSQHITQSLETVGTYPPANASFAPPLFHGAIGVTNDAVEGVDIVVPVFNFEVTRYLAVNAVTQTYVGNLYNLTGKVNASTFAVTVLPAVTLSFAAGECLFLGAAGSQRGDDPWELRFRFAGSPNRTNIPVGPFTVSSKKGWDYLWVRYADMEDTAAKAVVKRPLSAYVEKVYESGNFAQLGLS